MSRAPDRRGGEAEQERIVPGTPLWDEAYAEHAQRYEFVAARMPAGARVLDAGCGAGYGAALLLERGASRVVAVDVSREAIELARRHFDRPAITWITEDAHELEAAAREGPFDLVCNLENLEHLREPERFLLRVRAVLREDGVFVTSTPNRVGTNRLRGLGPADPTPNPFHHREFSVSEFRELLAPHFGEVALAFQTLDPIERLDWEPLVTSLWCNPAVRLGRWLQRALRGRRVPERLQELLTVRRYAILESDPGDARVLTQLAVCRRPRTRVP